MKKYFISTTFLLICQLLIAQALEHVEPPFWWRNMQNDELQIMLHGEDIGMYRVNIEHSSVDLLAVHQTENPNFLFVDVRILPGKEATSFDIEFEKEGIVVFSQAYDLYERQPNASDREGFDQSDVMYLITPDRFANGNPENDEVEGLLEGPDRSEGFGRHGGDIEGIRQHLDYIKDMGFTAIWLNPVLENDQPKWSYHGYATTDYYKVDTRFGTNEDYVQLSRQASKMGIKMVMDIIVNHCGSNHWWMKDAPTKDWVHQLNQPYVQTNHRKTTLLDPYVAPADREKMVQGWFVPTMPDLNQKNPFMSKYLIQNSIWWIEYAELGGLRQDTYSYPYRDFMSDWTCAIMNEYPNMNIVGEEWFGDPGILAYWQRGKQNADGYTSCLPSLMDFPLQEKLVEALNEEEGWEKGLTKLYLQLGSDYHYPAPEDLVIFPDNHDMPRIFKKLNNDYDLFKMAMAYILTTRGIPQIYYGTEILMAHPESDSHGDIREDFPGGWTGDAVDVFEKKGLTTKQKDAMAYVRRLLHWRQNAKSVHDGSLMHYIPEDGIYVFFRNLGPEHVMVIMNKNETAKKVTLDRFQENIGNAAEGKNVMEDTTIELEDYVEVPAKTVLIIEFSESE